MEEVEVVVAHNERATLRVGGTVLAAGARWLAQVVGELRSGELTWSREELLTFAAGQ